MITSPLTYGLFKPVILIPKSLDMKDRIRTECVLAHEYTHIRRLDVLMKWLLAGALSLHWFNPFVWVMYMLANRDIELSCDEESVLLLGEAHKSDYALTLINMEERRTISLLNAFSKNWAERRIRSIMAIKNKNPVSVIGLIIGLTVMAVSMSATAQTSDEAAPYVTEETITGETPAETPSQKGGLLRIMSFTDEFETILNNYFVNEGKLPEDIRIEHTIIPADNGAYMRRLDEILASQTNKSGDEVIDIFIVESAFAEKYINSPYLLDSAKLGFNDRNTSDMFQFTKDIATDKNGAVKAFSYQACPVVFTYRRSIAREVLGTDEPSEVQKYLDNWKI